MILSTLASSKNARNLQRKYFLYSAEVLSSSMMKSTLVNPFSSHWNWVINHSTFRIVLCLYFHMASVTKLTTCAKLFSLINRKNSHRNIFFFLVLFRRILSSRLVGTRYQKDISRHSLKLISLLMFVKRPIRQFMSV